MSGSPEGKPRSGSDVVLNEIVMPWELQNEIVKYRRNLMWLDVRRLWCAAWKSIICEVNEEYHRSYKWQRCRSLIRRPSGIALCHASNGLAYNWRSTKYLQGIRYLFIYCIKYRYKLGGGCWSKMGSPCRIRSKIKPEKYIYSLAKAELVGS